MGPEIPQVSKPDSDEGMVDFEESGRWGLSLRAALVILGLGIAFVNVMWIMDII